VEITNGFTTKIYQIDERLGERRERELETVRCVSVSLRVETVSLVRGC
jgi:hypothetical protein